MSKKIYIFRLNILLFSDNRWFVRMSNYSKSILNVNTYFMKVWYNQSGAVLHKLIHYYVVGNKRNAEKIYFCSLNNIFKLKTITQVL